MINVICDSCGYEIDYRPLRPIYEVDVQSLRILRKNKGSIAIEDEPMEINRYYICGKCLTKFYGHVASFFGSIMEDTQ